MKPISLNSLDFKNVSFEDQRGHKVLHELSMSFPLNQVVWVKGPAGGGKSLLLKLLCGLVEQTNGSFEINKEPVEKMSFEKLSQFRLNMGYSFDHGGLLNNRTLKQNLSLPLEYHKLFTHYAAEKKIAEILDYFDLKKYQDLRPSSIPGGMRKAAIVARSMLHDPEMLLLDDPTTGLRGDLDQRLKDLIRYKLQAGVLKHVFIATEDERLVSDFAEVVLLVDHGNLTLENIKKGAA